MSNSDEPVYVDSEEENKPKVYFSKQIDTNLLSLISDESKKYVYYKYSQKNKILNPDEETIKTINDLKNRITIENIKKYIAIYILMGVIKVPKYSTVLEQQRII